MVIKEIHNYKKKKIIRSPLYPKPILASFPSPAEDYADLTLDLNDYLIKNPPATFFAYAKGNSMSSNGIYDGDIAIIKKTNYVQNGKIAAVLTANNEVTLKTIKIQDSKIYLIPANNNYQEKVFNLNDVQIQGALSGLIRKYN